MFNAFYKYSILSPFNCKSYPAYLIVFVVLIAIFSPLNSPAQSRSFDVQQYQVKLDISDLSSKSISASTLLIFKALQDVTTINLSLKGLDVDSVLYHGQAINSNLTNENLSIIFPGLISSGTLDSISVIYHGKPVKDPSWGGVYFSNADQGYAFNMGVGFTDYPHNYGRVWFPCVDDFTDKATYRYEIITALDKSATCSGNFIDSFVSDNRIHWIYRQDKLISTYLSSFAVGNYSLLNFPDLKGRQIQTLCAVLPSDTQKFKSSFVNLGNCLDIFEQYYLSYQFDRIGFVVVPFNSGAMEHAVNIAYPKYAVTGTLASEQLLVHEFSHHWFGNLVTCRSDSDMWLNEGWAVYSEHLFLEKMYGQQAYLDAVKKNHKSVLQYAHIQDGAVYPLSPVPPEVTYGSTVYDKGADVVYCLRSYLGDSLFFGGVHHYLDSLKFGNATSFDLRNILAEYSGVNLTSFFDDWVFTKGFPHFYVDEFSLLDANSVHLGISDNPRFNNNTYQDVPLEIRFYSSKMEEFTKLITFSGHNAGFDFDLPFVPVMILIDPDSKIPDARSFDILKITETGKINFENGLMELDVTAVTDSALVAVIHHWNGPESRLSDGYRLSDYRYWTVKGVFPNGFDADATIQYNGREINNFNGNSYLDHTLGIDNEDSLVILYRQNPQMPWQEYPAYDLITGYAFNKTGSILIHHLKAGDYCLAARDYTQGTGFIPTGSPLKIYPNPSSGKLTIEFAGSGGMTFISLIDTNGKTLGFKTFSPVSTYTLSGENIPAMTAFIIAGNKNVKFTAKIIPAGNQ